MSVIYELMLHDMTLASYRMQNMHIKCNGRRFIWETMVRVLNSYKKYPDFQFTWNISNKDSVKFSKMRNITIIAVTSGAFASTIKTMVRNWIVSGLDRPFGDIVYSRNHIKRTILKADTECIDYELGVRCETGCESRLVTCLNECSPNDTRIRLTS